MQTQPLSSDPLGMASKRIRICNFSSLSILLEELLVKILIRPPLKTVGQLSCVCRSWNQIISSDYFIKTHAHHHKSSSNVNKFVLIDYPSNPTSIIEKHGIGSFNVLESYVYDADDIFGRDIDFNCLEIYGICDGVLYLFEGFCYWKRSNHRIFLWNPFLKKGKKLPPLRFQLEVEGKGFPCLCFRHCDDDYKVININSLQNVYHVYIYSLSADCWKFLKFDNPDHTYRFDIFQYPKVTLVNGVAYFVQKSESQDGRIVSFDLRREIIGYFNLPKDFDFKIDYIMKEYSERIALVSCDENRDMVMHVLRVGDNSFTWDKKFTAEAQCILLGSISKEELVTLNFDDHVKKCFLYNVEKGIGRRFPSLDLDRGALFLQRIHYLTESLILLGESTTSSACKNITDEYQRKVSKWRKQFLFLKMMNMELVRAVP
ncbi:F-box only protein 8-like [Apium graveolens]|uniref:F-box only protein 8-like n=1 Tax=Apium graveolens TaxID=4045 RepID=UPI003D7B860C